MKIKRLLSIVLVFCLLCSFAGVQSGIVYAAEDLTLCLYNDSDTTTLTPADGNAYGFPTVTLADNGKNEPYVTLAKDLTAGKGDVGRMELRKTKFDQSGYEDYRYLVMSAQLMPLNDSFTEIIWTTNSTQSISQPITVTDNSKKSEVMGKFNVGKWNEYTTVYDLSGDIKRAYTYVNGELVNTNIEDDGKNAPLRDISTVGSGTRIQLQMYGMGDCKMGADDIHIYLTNTQPTFTQPGLTSGDGYTIDEATGKVTVQKGTLVSALTSNGTATVWNDNTYSKIIEASTKLVSGNVIVVSNESGFAYYDVIVDTTPKTLALYNDSDTNKPAFAENGTGQYGAAVKTEASNGNGKTDSYLTVQKTAKLTDGNWSTRLQVQWSNLQNHGCAEYKYLVMSAQLMPLDEGITKINWTTNGNAELAQDSGQNAALSEDDSKVVSAIKINKWNEYTTVYDIENVESYTYVNGTLIASNKKSSGLRDIITDESSKNVQLQMWCAGQERIGVDDIHIYLTDNAPVFTQPILTPVDGKYTVNNDTNTVSVQKGTLVSDLVSSGTATVWSNNTYSETVPSTQQLSKGNVIVVSNDSGFAYYTVEIAPLTLCLYSDESTDGITFADTTGAYGSYSITKAGYGKKDSYLTVEKTAKLTDTQNWSDRLEIRHPNVKEQLKSPSHKYLVMSTQLMPFDDGFTKINWTTNGNALLAQPENYDDEVMAAIRVNKWNKYTTVYDFDTKKSYTYVNGVQIAQSTTSTGLNDIVTYCNTYQYSVRIQLQLWCSGDEKMGVDNVHIYLTDDYPEISQPVTIKNEPNKYLSINNNVLTTYKKMTPEDITLSGDATMTVFDTPTYDYELLSTNPMYNGNVIVLRTADDIYTYYDVKFYNANVPTVSNTNGTATATAYLMDSVMILACYDRTGDLADVDIADTANGNGEKLLQLTESENGEYATVKAFVWESLTSMTPIASAEWTNNPTIACWGASLTRGQGASDESVSSYPAVLQTLSGLNVYNMGVGGETVMTVAARQGSLKILLEEDITIPASGSVNIKFKASNGGIVTPREVNRGMWNPCSINGVEGTLSVVVDNTAWPRVLKSATFTRTTAGDAVVCPAGTELVVAAQSISPMADINIIELGSNGAWTTENLALEAHTTDAQRNSLAQMGELMVQNCKNPEKTYIISLSSMSKSDREPLDTILKNKFGVRYIDVGSYLQSEQALTDAGVAPTDLDKQYIAAGKVPPSLLNDKEDIENGVSGADVTHLNDAGYSVKAQYIYNRLKALGAF